MENKARSETTAKLQELETSRPPVSPGTPPGSSLADGNRNLHKNDKILVAVDGGGTRTRCAAFDANGQVRARAESGPSNHLVIESRRALDSVIECISTVLKESGVHREQVCAISVGLAGVDLGGEGLFEARESLRHLGFEQCIVHPDILTAHAGALGGSPGVLALSGTGAAFYGVAPDGRHARASGWGPAFGDEGSAFWIGQMVLKAASSAYDGRRPQTLLVELVCDTLGLRDFSETLQCIYRSPMQARLIADLGRIADVAADAGDAIARNILELAGDELACGAEAIVRTLKLNFQECRISWEGAVMRNSTIVRERFCEVLRERLPGISIVPPRFDPLYGAYLIGCKSLGWKAQKK